MLSQPWVPHLLGTEVLPHTGDPPLRRWAQPLGHLSSPHSLPGTVPHDSVPRGLIFRVCKQGASRSPPGALSAPALKSCPRCHSKSRTWWAPEGPLGCGSAGGPSTLGEELWPPGLQRPGHGPSCVLCPLPAGWGHDGHHWGHHCVRGRS